MTKHLQKQSCCVSLLFEYVSTHATARKIWKLAIMILYKFSYVFMEVIKWLIQFYFIISQFDRFWWHFLKQASTGLWPACAHLVSWNHFICKRWCMCVCLPPRELITSHVKRTRNNWIRQFYGFIYIWHLPSINWLGIALVTLRIMNTWQRRLRWCSTSYRRTTRQ